MEDLAVITMKQRKETKHTVVYEAEGEAVDSLYVQKLALPRPFPATIRVTLSVPA